MTDGERNAEPAGAQHPRGEEDEALERELQRESAEGADAIGDMRENRNLSGSSTWDTLDSRQRSDEEGRPEVF